MRKFWFELHGNWDTMAVYAEIYEANTEDEAIEIATIDNPNSTIRRVVELSKEAKNLIEG